MKPVSIIIRKAVCSALSAIMTVCLISSCVEYEEFADDERGCFESLWRTMDEHYCFFEEKKETLGVDWNEVHARYADIINDKMSSNQLFEVLGNMVGELRDGHVNLSAPFDIARNWSWKEDYPTNFSDTLQRRYLGTDYRISSGLRYRILDDNIGYIYCGTFDNVIGEGNLDYIMLHLALCNGLIIDVRNNGGGMITSAETLAQRFTDEKVLVGYMQHKTGKGHNDFSERQPQYINPSEGIRWHKPVCVLTNRGTYSAANEFAKYMKAILKANASKKGVPHGFLVGDTTGGGAGMPFSSELPNGWSVRFSACPMYDTDGNSTESGVAPDYPANITDADFAKGKDTIIELARSLLSNY